MAVISENRQQLAAPRLETASPPAFTLTAMSDEPPVLDLVPDSLEEPEPSFVAQARALAEKAPGSPTAFARLAQAHLITGELGRAGEAAEKALDLTREIPDGPAAFSAARTLILCGRSARAEEALAKLDFGAPTAVLRATLAVGRGDRTGAFELLGDDTSADANDLRGWIALCDHHYDQAVRFFRRSLREAGPSPAVLTNLGLAHAALGAPGKAIAETKQALALTPSNRHRVVFNLAAYLVSVGRGQEALRALADLQRRFPDEIEPVFAEAHWRLSIGDVAGAEKCLRRARVDLWGSLSKVQQSELEANLSYLRWHAGSLSRREAAVELVAQLKAIDWRSARLASMVAVLLSHFSDRETLEECYAGLTKANPGARFPAIEVYRLVLRDEPQKAAEAAVRWSEEEIFAPEAAITATFLLMEACDDFDRAVEIGKKALKRMPAALTLANNMAYALALSGRPDSARPYVPSGWNAVYESATRGIIEARKGRVEAARDWYDRAERKAIERDDPDLVSLVHLHRRLAASISGGDWRVSTPVVLSPDWDDQPHILMILRMLERREVSLGGVRVKGQGALPVELSPRT